MQVGRRRDQTRFCWLGTITAGCYFLAGCASPAGPRAPSLHLPEPVRDLAAIRSGGTVELTFTVPSRTTDGVNLRETTLQGVLCFQDAPAAPCRETDQEATRTPLPVPGNNRAETAIVTWRDSLPPALQSGPPRVVAYRVELRNGMGKSAGFSDPVYVAAGTAPAAVDAFSAKDVRAGVLLEWRAQPDGPGSVIVRREAMGTGETVPTAKSQAGAKGASSSGGPRRTGAARSQKEDVWLQTGAGTLPGMPAMVDGTVEEGKPYRYSAVRVTKVKLGGRVLEMRSAPSAVVDVVWRDQFPPATPSGFTALGYTVPGANGAPAQYAVDLIWQPVSDPRLTGYLVARQRLSASGEPDGEPEQLTGVPLTTTGFHDPTARAGLRYRYTLTAVDAKGNTSAPAIADVKAPNLP
jgi:hypothetical protein